MATEAFQPPARAVKRELPVSKKVSGIDHQILHSFDQSP